MVKGHVAELALVLRIVEVGVVLKGTGGEVKGVMGKEDALKAARGAGGPEEYSGVVRGVLIGKVDLKAGLSGEEMLLVFCAKVCRLFSDGQRVLVLSVDSVN